MFLLWKVYIFSLFSSSLNAFVINEDDFHSKSVDDELFDVEGFLRNYGYPFENHEVVTEDNYILNIHRIPYGRNEKKYLSEETVRPTVLFLHGLMGQSVDFLMMGPERSLGMMLADLGYDVWLGNNRGNTFSKKHKTLDPYKNKTYWDFSFHEMGMYDTPAIIDYVLNVSGNDNLTYIAHSQGTTQLFVLTSMKPQYNEKINLMVALAPVAYIENATSPLLLIVRDNYEAFDTLTNIFNITEVLPFDSKLAPVFKQFCSETSEFQDVCLTAVFLVCGFDPDQIDRTTISQLLDSAPAGASIVQMKHYVQEAKSGYFRQYDYGEVKNLEVYGDVSPPSYNISLIRAPVALYYGKNDWLVGIRDVERLAEELPNIVKNYLIEYELFSHLDFLIAKDVFSLLYYDVINLVNEYNGKDPIASTTTSSKFT